jgi:hypothetical protein
MTGILIIHTPSQLEQASGLVDLLEASLALPAGAILCSSLPGYAWPGRAALSSEQPARFAATLDAVGAAIALVDGATVRDPQVCFDLAAAWARGKRIALLADTAERRDELPPQLGQAHVVSCLDRAGIVSLVEDLAFDLGLSPRLGPDAQRALEQLSSAPPPPVNGRGNGSPARALEQVPAPAKVPTSIDDSTLTPVVALGAEYGANAPDADERDTDAAFELSDEDVEAVPNAEPLREAAPPHQDEISCELCLEAGRAISECAFHRDAGGDFAAELETSFGRFIDQVGGNWPELRRLGDVDVWLSATDNLLESLPDERKRASAWYELGFQFSTLQSIAEHGLPPDPDERTVYQELWNETLSAFRSSAENAGVPARPVRRLQALLENLIGPEQARDYTNIARSLEELRALAEEASRS